MNVVWRLNRATVRQMVEALQSFRPLAYTTVQTVLSILTEKKVVEYTCDGRAYVYSAIVQPEGVRKETVKALVVLTEGHVVEPICPRCLQADDDTPHLFNCVGTLAVRQELFGTVDVNLCALSEFQLQSIALARRTLCGVGAGAQDTTAPVEATQ